MLHCYCFFVDFLNVDGVCDSLSMKFVHMLLSNMDIFLLGINVG